MSQLPIREFDAKHIVAKDCGWNYDGQLITSLEDCDRLNPSRLRVIKPDQLFGKRGKLGLVGVKLNPSQVKEWLSPKLNISTTINEKTDVLHTFLAEPFVAHTTEWYIAFHNTKTHDQILISDEGGIEVEENWDKVKTLEFGVLEAFDREKRISFVSTNFPTLNDTESEQLATVISQLFTCFRTRGFSSLEINPLCFDENKSPVCLDMVARVDSCESRRQQQQRSDIAWVKAFGTPHIPAEDYIKSLDEKTGASLKFEILNPQGRIWLILGGGGASVITMDTLTNKGFLSDIANYGELSGNPDEDSNREYLKTIFSCMLANTAEKQYLCLIGGIANFTRIDLLCKPFAKLLEQYHQEILDKNIHLLVRRGGVRDTEGLAMIRKVCESYQIPHIIQDGDSYLTDIFDSITL